MLTYAVCFGAVAVETIFCPLFLKAQLPGKSLKSLLYKMVTSTGFLAIAAAAYFSGSRSDFALLMLCGAALSWLGDLFLHLKRPKVMFGVGFLAFLSGHILFTIAYQKQIAVFRPDSPAFIWQEILCVLLLFCGAVAFVLISKLKLSALFACAFAVYALFILTMAVKAARLGALALSLPNGEVAATLLASGGFLFVCSDFSLGVILADEKTAKSFPFKIFNIITYYLSETFLALSIFFF
ncbi:MAG: lysoplasmalogenase [Clostridia bacterium]|nr:lysoplasmalogenase [Clostridia bacterium]